MAWVTGHGDFVKSLLACGQLLAIVLAGLIFLFEYWDKLEADRLTRSLALIKESREEPLRGERYDLDTLFLERADWGEAVEAIKTSIADKNLCAYAGFVSGVIDKNNLVQKLYATTDFYNSVATCVSSGLCDQAAVCDSLYGRIKAQRSTFCPFYDDWKARWGQNVTKRIDGFLVRCERLTNPGFDPAKDSLIACDEIKKINKLSEESAYRCQSP